MTLPTRVVPDARSGPVSLSPIAADGGSKPSSGSTGRPCTWCRRLGCISSYRARRWSCGAPLAGIAAHSRSGSPACIPPMQEMGADPDGAEEIACSLLHNLVEPMDVGKYCPYCRPSYALMIASRATSSSSLYILTLIPISLIMFFMVLAITKSPNRLLNAENTISTSHRRP